MFTNNPNLQYFKTFLKNSSHKNGHFILQRDTPPCNIVYQNRITTWEKLPLFLNHLLIIWKYFVIIMKTLNSIEKILSQYYVLSFTF